MFYWKPLPLYFCFPAAFLRDEAYFLFYFIMHCCVGTCTRNMTARHNSKCSYSFFFLFVSSWRHIEIPNVPVSCVMMNIIFWACVHHEENNSLFCFIGGELRQRGKYSCQLALHTRWRRCFCNQ